MSSRCGKPAAMPWVTPYLVVKDADASVAFYERAFGFEKRFVMTGDDGKAQHAEMMYQGAVVMLGPECPSDPKRQAPVTTGMPAPVSLYVYCDDVDALFARATAAGAIGDMPPQDMF